MSRTHTSYRSRVRAWRRPWPFVVADGGFYDRANLDSLLIGVESLAKQSRRP